MAHATTFECEDCGQPATRARGGGKRKICADCGAANGPAAALQMAAKQGPAYERWLATNGPRGAGAHRRS